MKFGAVPNQSGIDWQTLLETWQELDRNSNFDSLWLMDHFVSGFGQEFGSEAPCMEGWTALAALAHATSRARLGILVTGNTYRHPAVLAKQATTVDHISGGRLIFGLGAGWHEYEHAAFGFGMPPVKERLDRLDESVGLIKALWTETRPTMSGNYYSLDRPPYNPPNVQQPHPPILIGGGGEKRTLRIVAKYADAANVSGSPEEVTHKWQVLDEHCRAIGRDPATVKRTIQAPLWLTDDPVFKERVAQGMAAASGRSPAEAARSVLLGDVDEVRAQVQAYKDAGVQEIYLAQWPRVHMQGLRTFSEEVIPEFA
ncbi:MAG: TIGR03560 family F420-dependent LLM class oxidoreductase [Dehalococcoidia bacterium]